MTHAPAGVVNNLRHASPDVQGMFLFSDDGVLRVLQRVARLIQRKRPSQWTCDVCERARFGPSVQDVELVLSEVTVVQPAAIGRRHVVSPAPAFAVEGVAPARIGPHRRKRRNVSVCSAHQRTVATLCLGVVPVLGASPVRPVMRPARRIRSHVAEDVPSKVACRVEMDVSLLPHPCAVHLVLAARQHASKRLPPHGIRRKPEVWTIKEGPCRGTDVSEWADVLHVVLKEQDDVVLGTLDDVVLCVVLVVYPVLNWTTVVIGNDVTSVNEGIEHGILVRRVVDDDELVIVSLHFSTKRTKQGVEVVSSVVRGDADGDRHGVEGKHHAHRVHVALAPYACVIFRHVNLHKLATKYGADKAPHGYCDLYEQHLGRFRSMPDARLLELGVLNGASLRMWREWFKGEVHGADIKLTKDIKGVVQHVLNLEVIEDIRAFASTIGMFEFILDDAGHTMEQQQQAFDVLLDNVKPGCVYVLEDLGTSMLPDKVNKYTKIAYNVWREPTSLQLIEALRDKRPFSSRWISAERYERIAADVESVHVLSKDQGVNTPSITSVIVKRCA